MNKEWQIKEAERINEKFGNENFEPVSVDKIKNGFYTKRVKEEKQDNGKD